MFGSGLQRTEAKPVKPVDPTALMQLLTQLKVPPAS